MTRQTPYRSSPYRSTRALASLLAALLAGGCAEDLYRSDLVPPKDAKGEECLQRCDLLRSQCRGRQETRANECRSLFEAARADYALCIEAKGADCRSAEPCLPTDLGICDQEHRDCGVACGGQVDRRFEGWRWPWQGKPKAAPAQDAGKPQG